MDKISIIIPVYNTVNQIERCLKSICGQSYTNLEIICIDDGSTDGSEKIVDEFAKKDARMIVIHQKNQGESNARNQGLKLVTGRFIGFMDCDDWIEPSMYEDLYTQMIKKDADMVACNYFVDTDNTSVKVINQSSVSSGLIDRKQLYEYVYQRDRYKGFTGYIWCKLFNVKVLKNKNEEMILFDESLSLGGDILYFSQIASNCKRVYYLEESYYHYYQREDSGFHEKNANKRRNILDAYIKVIQNLEARKIEPESWVWIQRFLVYHACVVAKYAFEQKNKEVLEECQLLMQKYEFAYLSTNKNCADRINYYQTILKYEL